MMNANEPLRVLFVEDSASDAKLIAQELRKLGRPIESERVEDLAGMRSALALQRWDAVISDWSMPKFTAPAALALLRELGLDVPFIIVSGTIGEEALVEAMRSGAHDYVLKDRLGRLTAVVERELRESKERVARRQVESALRESEARFARLADSGIIGIVFADVFGTTLDANEAYLRIVGYTREELVSGAILWGQLTPPEWIASDQAALAQLEETGAAQPWEKELLRKDGTRVPVLIGVAMLDHPKCIVFVADLTARKRAEAGRTRAEEALRQSEEQLRQSQKMEAVGRLAGGVAHDFNNMLSVILSYGELMLSVMPQADPMRADVDEIRKAANRAASLTRQLLLFSRQQVAEPRVIDLNDVLSTMSNMLQRILGEDVELVSIPSPALWYVHVDVSHIEQVVMNLVVNARDAMPIGGKLTIETANVELDADYIAGHLPAKTGAHVMLSITDTGCGIDRAVQERMFEPFYTTKERGKGTGLGLSTVFGIVQQSGGNIWVYSEVGKGTTFKIYLPRIESDIAALHQPVAPATLRGDETILVVEDEDQVRAIVVTVLRKHGYRVLAAENAGEALLLCERHVGRIDLLLTDVVMPQMSGPELAKRLTAGRPDVRVLCMSGYTDDSIVRHGVLEAHMAFLQKPITPATLTRKVREVLDKPVPAPGGHIP